MSRGGGSGRLRRLGGRLGRLVRGAVLALLAFAALVLLGLALPPVRGALLDLVLGAADRALPGSLTVAARAWPRLGTIELGGVVWVHAPPDSPPASPPDTLVHARRLVVAVDAGALRHRDLVADSLVVDLAELDLPAIAALFPPGAAVPDTAPAAPRPAAWSGSFPRAGSLAGAPSVAVQRLAVGLESAVLGPGLAVRGLRLQGRVDLHAERPPAFRLRLGPASLSRAGGGPAGADSVAVELTRLALDAGWDQARGQVRIDSLDVEIAAAGTPELTGRWRGLPPLTLRGAGRVGPVGGALAADFTARLALPGAPLLARAWPAAVAPGDYAVLAADLVLAGRTAADSSRVRLDLDLAAEPGPGRIRVAAAAAFAHAAVGDGRFGVDTLAVTLPGIALAGGGVLDRGVLAAAATARAATPIPLLAALVPASAGAAAALDLDLEIGGTLADPRLRLELGGRAATAQAAVPRLAVLAEGTRRELILRLGAGGAVVGDSLAFADTLAVTLQLRPAGPGGLADGGPLAVALDGRIGRARRLTHGRVVAQAVVDPARPALATVVLDTIDLAAPGVLVRGSARRDTAALDLVAAVSVSAPCPLLEAMVPGLDGGGYAADLALTAAGQARDPHGSLDLVASCDLPRLRVPSLVLQAAGDRRDLAATLRAGGGLEADGRAWADAVTLEANYAAADSLPLRAGLRAGRGADRVGLLVAAGADGVATIRLDSLALVLGGQRLDLQAPAVVRLDTVARRIELSSLALAGDPGTMELAGTLSPQHKRLLAGLDLLLPESLLVAVAPDGPWSRGGGFDLGAAGTVELELGPGDTRFDGEMRVEMRPHREEPILGAQLAFRLAEGDSAGLAARFAATAADTALLHGSARLPGRYEPRTKRWVADGTPQVQLQVPEQTVPMGLLSRLLPAGTGIRGDLSMAATASVPLAAPAGGAAAGAGGRIAGSVRSPRLSLALPNNSRLELRIDGKVSGPLADPRLGGKVRVTSGFLRIPEIPRSLHPAEGEPALWQLAAPDSAAAADATLPQWGPGGDRPAPPAPYLPDLDLVVEVPGNLMIRGYGLDVEVAADVTVGRGLDARGRPGPALHGDARAVRGSLKFMNRTFDLQRADVRFTGSVPADPELDLDLQTTVSGTVIRLRVTGRATAPIIDLTSDPDLDRADIVAVLLFGRPLNDLDAEQRGRTREQEDPAKQLQENLASLALAFGTADLRNTVSGALGVDIVEVGADSQGGSTLTAGKYLSPRILVKYNASLEQAGTYFVTLEYVLTELLRVVSTYGQGEEASGLELKWLRRY